MLAEDYKKRLKRNIQCDIFKRGRSVQSDMAGFSKETLDELVNIAHELNCAWSTSGEYNGRRTVFSFFYI